MKLFLAFASLVLFSVSVSGNDTRLFVGEWQQIGYSKTLEDDYSKLKGKDSANDFIWVIQAGGQMIMKNDVYNQKAKYKINFKSLVITHTGFDIDFEIIDLTKDKLIVKDGLGSYQYYERR